MSSSTFFCYLVVCLALVLSCTFRLLSGEGKVCVIKGAMPKKYELQNLDVIDNLVDYSKVGTCLLNDDYGNKIKKLEKEYSSRSLTAIVEEVFRLWTNGEGAKPISWAGLVVCLRSAKLNRLADEIESAYCAEGSDDSRTTTAPKTIRSEGSVHEKEPQTALQLGLITQVFIATIVVVTLFIWCCCLSSVPAEVGRISPDPVEPTPPTPEQEIAEHPDTLSYPTKTSKSKDDWKATMRPKVDSLLREGKDGLHILVTGRTGAGKSALVNSIIGEYVAEEGDSPRGETSKVTNYETKLGDFTVTIYDSPDLQDGMNDDLEKTCKEVDLNLYCVKMNDKIRPSEYDVITKLSRVEEFWQKTLFVLTFANDVTPPKRSFTTPADYFNKQMSEWKTLLQDALTDKAGITKEVAESVPILPAGFSDEPSLPAADSDNWLSNLWFQLLELILLKQTSEKINEQDDGEATVIAIVDCLLSQGKDGLRILVMGRTGAGKSALVNSIVGEYVAEEGDSPRGETTKVTKYEKKLGDFTITIYDSPGFHDGMDNLEVSSKEVDLYLYCVKMDDKIRPSEYDAITKLSRVEEFWQKTLFVLTFANVVTPPKRIRSANPADYFNKQMSEWKTLLQDALTDKAGITKEVAESVPILPASFLDERLPDASYDYWLNMLLLRLLEPIFDAERSDEINTEQDNWEATILTEVYRLLSELGKGDLHILVTGRTGAGKSALVNSIVGEYVAEEGDSPYGETIKVTKYEKKIGAVTVTIYDSPGLQDGIEDKSVEEQYLKDLEENCREVDLNLYCVKMKDRMRPSEKDAMTKLSRSFGMNKFWQKTLFILTFANEITPPRNDSSSTLIDHFSNQMSAWKALLQYTLTAEAGVTKEVAENVPIVPAGYFSEPSLPGANCDYWLSKLWFECLDRTKDSAKPILLNINWERLRPSEEVNEEDIPNKKGYEQPINRDVIKPDVLKSYFAELL